MCSDKDTMNILGICSSNMGLALLCGWCQRQREVLSRIYSILVCFKMCTYPFTKIYIKNTCGVTQYFLLVCNSVISTEVFYFVVYWLHLLSSPSIVAIITFTNSHIFILLWCCIRTVHDFWSFQMNHVPTSHPEALKNENSATWLWRYIVLW